MLPGSDLGTRRKAATVNPQLAPTRHLEVAGQRDDPLVQGRERRRLNHVRRPSRRSARATSCWIRRGSEPSPVAFRSYVRPGHRGSAFWLMLRAAGELATPLGGASGVLVHHLLRQVGQRAIGVFFLVEDGVQRITFFPPAPVPGHHFADHQHVVPGTGAGGKNVIL